MSLSKDEGKGLPERIVLVGKPEGNEHLKVLGMYWTITLKRIFKKSNGGHGLN